MMDTQTDCTQTPAPGICGLIQSVYSQRDREARAKQAAVDAEIKEGLAFLNETIAPIWDEIKPHVAGGQAHAKLTDRGDLAHLYYAVTEGVEILGLLKFWIYFKPNHGRVMSTWSEDKQRAPGTVELSYDKDKYHSPSFEWERRAEFFAELHEAFVEKQAKDLKEDIDRWQLALLWGYNNTATTRVQADVALAKLIELAPEGREKWELGHAAWVVAFEKHEADLRERDRQLAERKAEHDRDLAEARENSKAYRAEYAGYWLRLQRVRQHNAERLAALQAKLDQTTFPALRLTYGICAMNEDGETFADTATAYVSSGAPNDRGEWLTYKDHQAKLIWYTHPVSCEPLGDYKPGEHKSLSAIQEFPCGAEKPLKVYASPLQFSYIVAEQADIWIEPAAPEEPVMHDYRHWLYDIREEIERGAPAATESSNSNRTETELPF